MQRSEVYEAIDSERDYQDAKWGSIGQHPHEVEVWLLLMEQYLADARKAWASSPRDEAALLELRKVVSLGVACMEQHGAVPGHRRWLDADAT